MGHNFLNWSFKHVVLWVTKGFQSFGPEKWVLIGWRLSFMLEGQSGFSRKLTHARAGTFTLERKAWVHELPLERRESRSNVKCVYPEVCVFCSPLERGKPRSSEGLCHTLKRGSSVKVHARAWVKFLENQDWPPNMKFNNQPSKTQFPGPKLWKTLGNQ